MQALVCTHMYLFMWSLTHVQPSMHLCCHLSVSLRYSLHPFGLSLPRSCLCSWENRAWSQKCKCAAWLMSHRDSASPHIHTHPTISTVGKYVVSLIEHSTSSQQLSFLLFVCVFVHNHTFDPEGRQWHTAVQKSHIIHAIMEISASTGTYGCHEVKI